MNWLFERLGEPRKQHPEVKDSNNEINSSELEQVSVLETSSTFAKLDPARLHPLAGLDKPLDYLILEDEELNKLPGSKSLLPSRGWSDDLCYGTGTTYLTALGIGGAYGLYEGLSNTQYLRANKLKLNAVLNAVTRRGPFLANSAAIVALMYNGLCCSLDYYRGKHDWRNSVSAGVLSGMLFKSTKGIKPMLIAGSLTGFAAVSWCGFKKVIFGMENPSYTIEN